MIEVDFRDLVVGDKCFLAYSNKEVEGPFIVEKEGRYLVIRKTGSSRRYTATDLRENAIKHKLFRTWEEACLCIATELHLEADNKLALANEWILKAKEKA